MNGQNCVGSDCRTVIDREARVQTPVDVKVIARLGDVELQCCGEPATAVTDCKDGCRLLVVQHLNVRIPLYYEAVVSACRSETDCAEDC